MAVPNLTESLLIEAMDVAEEALRPCPRYCAGALQDQHVSGYGQGGGRCPPAHQRRPHQGLP